MRKPQRSLPRLLPLPPDVPPRSEDEQSEENEEEENDSPDGEFGFVGGGSEEVGEADLEVGDEGGSAV